MERLQADSRTTERDQRERLEQLQMELRQARTTLATATEDASRAEASLRTAIEDATIRRDAARTLIATREAEKRALEKNLKELEPRLAAKREEAAVLARGAVLRDHYVDWNPDDQRRAVDNGFTRAEVGAAAWSLLGSLLLLGALLYVFR
jgi:vancomycin resistance protein YoaR